MTVLKKIKRIWEFRVVLHNIPSRVTKIIVIIIKSLNRIIKWKIRSFFCILFLCKCVFDLLTTTVTAKMCCKMSRINWRIFLRIFPIKNALKTFKFFNLLFTLFTNIFFSFISEEKKKKHKIICSSIRVYIIEQRRAWVQVTKNFLQTNQKNLCPN